jgi:hypothetical protein
VLRQVVTPSLLHVEIVVTRRLHYLDCHLATVALASAKCTVQLASGGIVGAVSAAARR